MTSKTKIFTHRPRVSLARFTFGWWRHNRHLMTSQRPDHCLKSEEWYLTRLISILFTVIFMANRVRNYGWVPLPSVGIRDTFRAGTYPGLALWLCINTRGTIHEGNRPFYHMCRWSRHDLWWNLKWPWWKALNDFILLNEGNWQSYRPGSSFKNIPLIRLGIFKKSCHYTTLHYLLRVRNIFLLETNWNELQGWHIFHIFFGMLNTFLC